MPTRTKEEQEVIANTPEMQSTDTCNARTGNADRPYCQMKAGTRTDHVGKGRCWLHGGRAGRPIATGVYSSDMKSTLQKQYDKFVADPNLISLHDEMAAVKAVFTDLMAKISEDLEEERDIWEDMTAKGTPILGTKVKALTQIVDTMSRVHQRIVDTEIKLSQSLTLRQIMNTVMQIKNAMSACGECPVRRSVAVKLSQIKIGNIVESDKN